MSLRSRTALEKGFGEAIRRVRSRLGFTQEQLGKRAGIHRTYINQLEHGLRSPSLGTMHRLARALSTPLERLIREAYRGRDFARSQDTR